ncbi:MAG TPA: alkaline phosphatase family protein, partial [Planctomycetota bacterium]
MLCLASLFAALIPYQEPAATGPDPRPALVVQIVIDQLPAATLEAALTRFPPGGFRYLAEHGTAFTACKYAHASTFTACGHATLATGAHPQTHGLVANEWADPVTGERHVYCVQTDAARVGDRVPGAGAGPGLLLVDTLADHMGAQFGPSSLAFAVSGKDRGAVLLAGRHGKAFWHAGASGRFVSSRDYFPDDALPDWAQAWNEAGEVPGAEHGSGSRLRGKVWELQAGVDYHRLEADERIFETMAFGKVTFPYTLPANSAGRTNLLLRLTPFFDELTLDFTAALLDHEALGRDAVPDFLGVSFSGCDYVGHLFGPFSLEAEDHLLRLDRTLARLLALLDRHVGLERVLVVLSSDHGVNQTPEQRQAWLGQGGRISYSEVEALAREALTRELALPAEAVLEFWNPGLYLDQAVLHAHDVDPARAATVAARALENHPGIRFAFSRAQLAAGRADAGEVLDMVRRGYRADRSG